jgi:hypothetical protein
MQIFPRYQNINERQAIKLVRDCERACAHVVIYPHVSRHNFTLPLSDTLI